MFHYFIWPGKILKHMKSQTFLERLNCRKCNMGYFTYYLYIDLQMICLTIKHHIRLFAYYIVCPRITKEWLSFFCTHYHWRKEWKEEILIIMMFWYSAIAVWQCSWGSDPYISKLWKNNYITRENSKETIYSANSSNRL